MKSLTVLLGNAPRMAMVWRVLERAQDAGDLNVILACRRLIEADRLGWRKYANADDWRIIKAFDE